MSRTVNPIGHADNPRVLALDPGLRRTGIALSDPSARLASPLETVELPPRRLIEHICSLIEDHGVGLVLVGLPRLPSGQKGEIAQLSEYLADKIHRRAGVEVLLWDETLTSWEAESILKGTAEDPKRSFRGGGPMRRKGRAKRGRDHAGAIDRLAAALLLQDYLDTRKTDRASTGIEGGIQDAG
ncbi:MAG: Holliday junction resolvase RuvX, partial [Candidatus Eisenbacteria sp.]|nr:Holliday junction resolvase RuvX [Candidatus Eisenbacteria bacterium]